MNITNIAILFGFVVWFLHFLPICDGLQKKFNLTIIYSSVLAAIISLVPFVNIIFTVCEAIKGLSWK